MTATLQDNVQPSTSGYEPRESNLSFDRRSHSKNNSETDDIDDDYYSLNEEMNSVRISRGCDEYGDDDDDEVYLDAEEFYHGIDFQEKCEQPQVEQIRKGCFSRAKGNGIKESKKKPMSGRTTVRAARGIGFFKNLFNL